MGLAVSPGRRLGLYPRSPPHHLNGLVIRAFLRHLLRHRRGQIEPSGIGGVPIAVEKPSAATPGLRTHCFHAYGKLNLAEFVWLNSSPPSLHCTASAVISTISSGKPKAFTPMRFMAGGGSPTYSWATRPQIGK